MVFLNIKKNDERLKHQEFGDIVYTKWGSVATKSLSWGSHNSNFTMVYGRYIELVTMVYKPTNITGGAPRCAIMTHSARTCHTIVLLGHRTSMDIFAE